MRSYEHSTTLLLILNISRWLTVAFQGRNNRKNIMCIESNSRPHVLAHILSHFHNKRFQYIHINFWTTKIYFSKPYHSQLKHPQTLSFLSVYTPPLRAPHSSVFPPTSVFPHPPVLLSFFVVRSSPSLAMQGTAITIFLLIIKSRMRPGGG